MAFADAEPHDPGAKMHAKLAIADGKTLLVSSANLTQSEVSDSLEAGLLVRGGTAPEQALEYVRDLQARGLLSAPLFTKCGCLFRVDKATRVRNAT